MTAGVFAGEPVMRKGAILWVAAEGEKEIEGGASAPRSRTSSEAQALNPSRARACRRPTTDRSRMRSKNSKPMRREAAKYAQRKSSGLPLALIVIDTVSAAAGFTDENSASETQKGHDHPAGAFARDRCPGAAD